MRAVPLDELLAAPSQILEALLPQVAKECTRLEKTLRKGAKGGAS